MGPCPESARPISNLARRSRLCIARSKAPAPSRKGLIQATSSFELSDISKVLIRGGLRSNRPGSDGSLCWVALQDDLREALPQTPGRWEACQTLCSPLRSHKNASE